MKKIDKYVNRIIEGDCLDIMTGIPDKSIDMILCDLPYGTTQNKWDTSIDFYHLWEQYERIIKDHGAIVLTSQGLFTGKLIMSKEQLFKYKIVWIKSVATNYLNAKKQPLRKHEDICVFYKKQPTYHPQMMPGKPYVATRHEKPNNNYGLHASTTTRSKGLRYPTDVCIDKVHLVYEDYVFMNTALSEGRIYHPTQKPVNLGRYLIRTYSDINDIILDNACGSGSFLVAAILEGRRFIGIEKNKEAQQFKNKADYIAVCRQRIQDAYQIRNNSFQ